MEGKEREKKKRGTEKYVNVITNDKYNDNPK